MAGSHWLPISSYPVQREFSHRWLQWAVVSAMMLAFLLLTIWNVITQGKIHVFSTSFESQFFESNSTITCQGDTITAGNQLFTNDPTRVPGSAAAQGNFSWQLLSVYVPGVNGGVSNGFGYRGERISKVSITKVDFTLSFNRGTFNYAVCADAMMDQRVSVRNVTRGESNSTRPIVLNLCTVYDLTSSNLPPWTAPVQERIQTSIFRIGVFWQLMNFANNTFPVESIPPYHVINQNDPRDVEQGMRTPNDTTITPEKIVQINAYLARFNYTPSFASAEDHNDLEDHETNVYSRGEYVYNSIEELADASFPGLDATGGFGYQVNGIGIVSLATKRVNDARFAPDGSPFVEPPVITDMRDRTFRAMEALMHNSTHDLFNRTFGASYICTSSHLEWRDAASMVSVILGSNAGVIGLIFGLVIAIARWYDMRDGADDDESYFRHRPPMGMGSYGRVPLGQMDMPPYAVEPLKHDRKPLPDLTPPESQWAEYKYLDSPPPSRASKTTTMVSSPYQDEFQIHSRKRSYG